MRVRIGAVLAYILLLRDLFFCKVAQPNCEVQAAHARQSERDVRRMSVAPSVGRKWWGETWRKRDGSLLFITLLNAAELFRLENA